MVVVVGGSYLLAAIWPPVACGKTAPFCDGVTCRFGAISGSRCERDIKKVPAGPTSFGGLKPYNPKQGCKPV